MTLTHGLFPNRTNAVYLSGTKMIDEGLANGAVTPGALLITGSTDNDVEEAGAGALNVIGFALENDLKASDTETVLADYANNDWVPYNVAPGVGWMAILANGESVAKGDKLKPAANGEVAKFVSGTDAPAMIVGKYMGDADVTASGSTRIPALFGGF